MSIRLKLIAGLVITALPLILGGALSIEQTNRLDRDFSLLLRETTPALEMLAEIDGQSHRLISEAVSYALLRVIRAPQSEIQEEKAELNESRRRLRELLVRYENLGRENLRGVFARKLRTEIEALDKSAVSLARRVHLSPRALIPLKEGLEKHEGNLTDLCREARGFEQSLLKTNGERIHNTVLRLSLIIAGATLCVFLFLLAYMYFVNRDVSRPLQHLTRAADEIGEGYLTVAPDIGGGGEIGSLARSFRRMAGRLRVSTVSRRYVNEILETMRDMLLVIDRGEGRIRTVNASLLKTLGYELHELKGRPWSILLDEEEAPDSVIEEALRSGEKQLRWKKRGGETFPVMFFASRMLESGEELFVCTARDISEEVRNANILKHARDSAEAASRAKSEFLANISHELRTPLNAILGTTDLLSEAPLPERELRHVKNLMHGGESLLRLINEILDSARIEAGGLELKNEIFEFESWYRVGCALHEAAIKSRGLTYEYFSHPDIPAFVEGDPQRLRQILDNLINNAMKFTSSGGITVKAFPAEKPDMLGFQVIDSGMGVPPEKQELIFQAFEQADTSITRRFGGTGLGLAICRRLVRHMGGDIHHRAGENDGSVFEFQVICPARRDAAHDSATYSKREAPPSISRSLRILLAEDNENNSNLVRAFLHETPCRLEIVPDGSQAVELFKKNSYDLVLMDVQMPVMDGYTAVREIRRWENETGAIPTPVLALTAHAMREDHERSLEAGCDEHLTKPIRKQLLLESIARFTSLNNV